MFSRISEAWHRKFRRTRKNILSKIEESGALFQPLPEASDDEEKVEDVNLAELWKHILELREPREKGNHKKAGRLRAFRWPNVPGLQDLKGIVLLRSDLLITDIHEDVKTILGRVNVATVAPLVVAHTLERYKRIINRGEHNHTSERLDASITNGELWHLTEAMYDLAIVLKGLSESPERTQDVMQDATSLIVEGARVFSLLQRGPLKGGPPGSASDVSAIQQKLDIMYTHINTKFTVGDFTPMQPQQRYNGQVEEDLLFTRRQEVFKMEALVAATNNFHKDNKVGEGGAGAVYKGTTHDGKQIAVKKMLLTSDEGRKAFMNEKLPAKVQHRNVVNLLGLCEQESQGFLVYEYFPNKSLDKFLFDPKKRKRLDWHKRSKIILGIARGLLYLHQDSRVRIIHRDIKATNILLDDELNPQIADFGTANILPENKTHVTATSAVGTFGYMPPDILMSRRFSPRTEVYSFGILLLEILTGEKISSDAVNHLGRVWRLYNTKEALQTIDPTIIETSDKEATKALRCIQVGLLCIQANFGLRPTMAEVIDMLSTDMSLKDPENPPCLPSYCATQENGNSAREKLMSFMRGCFSE